jgi:hypothetical protein
MCVCVYIYIYIYIYIHISTCTHKIAATYGKIIIALQKREMDTF